MRVLAVTSLYPNRFQPNLAAFNRQQFAALRQIVELKVIAPIPWTASLHGAGAAEAETGVEHPKFFYPPKVLRRSYGRCFRWSVKTAFSRAVDAFRPEVVLGAWAYPDGWAVGELSRQHGLPVVIKVHGSDVLTLQEGSVRWRRTVEALREADGVVAVSGNLAQRVRDMGVAAQKVRVVRNGVDVTLFSPGPKDDSRRAIGISEQARVLLYVGNLYHVKGVDTLISACAILKKSMAFECYLVGAGTERASLERQVAELGLGEQVKFAGAKAHRELPTWFRAADVVVLPSRSEGVPNVLMEASACGVPFVATRVGGVPEIMDLGVGRLVEREDATGMAAALAEVLERAGTPAGERPTRAFRSHADSAAELAGALAAACGSSQELVNT